jgi:hypothetical protein
MIEDAVPQSY